MSTHLKASLCVDGLPDRTLTPAERISERLQIVLNTRPGQIPWRPDFGCDLSSLVGRPATANNLSEARGRVTSALSRSLPDVEFERCEVRVSERRGAGDELRHPTIPLAEAALLSLGVQAGLEVVLEVRVPEGRVSVSAPLNL